MIKIFDYTFFKLKTIQKVFAIDISYVAYEIN